MTGLDLPSADECDNKVLHKRHSVLLTSLKVQKQKTNKKHAAKLKKQGKNLKRSMVVPLDLTTSQRSLTLRKCENSRKGTRKQVLVTKCMLYMKNAQGQQHNS